MRKTRSAKYTPQEVRFRTYSASRSYTKQPAVFLDAVMEVDGKETSVVMIIPSKIEITDEAIEKYSEESILSDNDVLDALDLDEEEKNWIRKRQILSEFVFETTVKAGVDREIGLPSRKRATFLTDFPVLVNVGYFDLAEARLSEIPEPSRVFERFLDGLYKVAIDRRTGKITGRTARSFALNIIEYCKEQSKELEKLIIEKETKISNRIIRPAGKGEKITARTPKAIAKNPDPENVEYFNTVDTIEKREALAAELIKNNLACFYTTFDGEPTAVAKVLKVIEQASEAYRARYMWENERGEQPTPATTGVLSKDNKTLTVSLELLARERPDYDKLTPKEQRAERLAWFKALVYASSRPCMFYAGMEQGRDKTVIKQLFLLEYDTLAPLDHDIKLIEIDPVLLEPSKTGGKRRHGFSRIDRRAYQYLQSSTARPETVKAAFLVLNHVKARITTMINHAEATARTRDKHRKEGEPEILPTYQPVEIVLADLVTYQKTYLSTKTTRAKGIVHEAGERVPILPRNKEPRDAVLKELEIALSKEHISMMISESRESIILEIKRDS